MENAQLWPDSAEIQKKSLVIANNHIPTLAKRFGTPLYVMDEATVINTIAELQKGLAPYSAETAIHYASKAMLNTALAQLVTRHGLGLDVVSLGELALAKHAGIDLAHVHLHGNATPPHELRQAVEWGIGRIIIDNEDQLQHLIGITNDLRREQNVWLRIAPDVVAGGHTHIQTGAASSKFGLNDPTTSLNMLEDAAFLTFKGIHAHIGSQIRDLPAFALTIERLIQLMAALKQRGIDTPELCLGGGLAVNTLPEQQVVPIAAYCHTLINSVAQGCRQHALPLPLLGIEPGRAIVARSTVAVYTVTGRKPLQNQPDYLHIDGGMGDNIRPAMYGAKYHALLANRAVKPSQPYRISGRYCESSDVLIKEVQLPRAEVGDVLAVPISGAYTLSMASNYNGVARPPLLLLRDGEAHVIQERESAESLWARDLPLP